MRWLSPLITAALIFLFIPIGVLQWFATTLIFLVLLSYLYVRLLESRIRVYRLDNSPRTFRLQPAVIHIAVENPLPLKVTTLLVSDEAGGMAVIGENVGIFAIHPGQRIILEYRVKTDRRGSYFMGPITLKFSDPLGLFPREVQHGPEITMLVLPRVYPMERLIADGLPIGEIPVNNLLYEDPGRYRSMREYVVGDDPRRINWKASAKSEEIQVMEYASTLSSPLTVILNLDIDCYNPKKQYQSFERCIELAASVSSYWDSLDQEYALLINSPQHNSIPRGKSQIAALLELLAQLEAPEPNCVEIGEILSNIRFGHSERIIVISPPVLNTKFESWISLLPPNCYFEFWMLQEDSLRKGYVNPVQAGSSSSKRIAVRSISHYGEHFFND